MQLQVQRLQVWALTFSRTIQRFSLYTHHSYHAALACAIMRERDTAVKMTISQIAVVLRRRKVWQHDNARHNFTHGGKSSCLSPRKAHL